MCANLPVQAWASSPDADELAHLLCKLSIEISMAPSAIVSAEAGDIPMIAVLYEAWSRGSRFRWDNKRETFFQ